MDILFHFLKVMEVLEEDEIVFLQNLMSWQYIVSQKDKIAFENRVPQGSVLSPALFNIYTHILIKKMQQAFDFRRVDHYYLYADDLAFICKE
jgi:hypothetical protein